MNASLSPRKFWQFSIAVVGLWLALWAVGLACGQAALVSPFDTGVYLDVLSSLERGAGLSAPVLGESNFLAHHFQPLVPLLLPFFWISPSAATLFAVSLACLLATLYIVGRCTLSDRPSIYQLALVCLFLTHPALLCRLYASFTPELISLPAYTWLALQLRPKPQTRPPGWLFFLALLVAGLGKENFWLINAWLCLLFWWQQRRPVWLAASGAQFALFALLFLWWMPAHTNLEGYYGWTFYGGDPDGGVLNLVLSMLGNLISYQSALTLLVVLLLSGGMAVAGLNLALIGTVPGLAMILTASASQVHHPANHYLIPVLPFLFAAGLTNLERWQSRFGRLAPVIALLGATIGVATTITFPGGLFDKLQQLRQVSASQPERRESLLGFIQAYVQEGSTLVTDGLYQPLASPRHQPTVVLLGFSGNPYRLDMSSITRPFYVYTDAELHKIPDCRGIEVGGQHLEVDYHYFLDLCLVIQRNGKVIYRGPNGATGYLITPAANTIN